MFKNNNLYAFAILTLSLCFGLLLQLIWPGVKSSAQTPISPLAETDITSTSTLINLGTLGGRSSAARDINDNGDVIGSSETASNQIHAFLYRDGEMIDLGTLGGTFSSAFAINNNGDVVGHASTASGQEHAFLYRNGQMIDLGTLGGGSSSARGINNNGDIYGQSFTASGERRAFLYRNNQMIDLGTLGGLNSDASAINNNGDVVGQASIASGQQRAFLYRDDQMINLGTLPGGSFSSAYGINDNGDVVGQANTASGQNHAFLYRDGQMIDLGALGDNSSQARGINNNGDIYGQSFTARGPYRAFLYRDNQMIDLGTLGGTITSALGINNNGDIYGQSSIANGPYHAFLYRNNQMIDLGTLGGSYSFASGINNNGDVVGESPTANGELRGFLYRNNAALYSLSATPRTVAANSSITVSWNITNPTTSPTDWIGLFRVGAPNDAANLLWSSYTAGAAAGTRTLNAPAENGDYEFRLFENNTFALLATSNTITVNSTGQLINPSFEQGFAPWFDWGNSDLVANPDAPTGSFELRIGTGSGGSFQTVSALSNTSYLLSGWGRVSRAGETGWIGVHYLDSNGNEIAGQSVIEFTNTNYEQKQIAVQTPANTAGLRVWVWKNEGAGYLFVDEINLTR